MPAVCNSVKSSNRSTAGGSKTRSRTITTSIRLQIVFGTRACCSQRLQRLSKRRLHARIEREGQELGPAVVADAVHHAFALGDQLEVELGVDDAFAFGERLAQERPVRRHDRGVATTAQGVLEPAAF